jgi:hypothetical protein
MLERLPGATPLFHRKYRRRHPLGLYNESVSQILQRFEKALQALNALCVDPVSERTVHLVVSLVEAYDALLDALMEHLDDCLRLLQCFFDDHDDYLSHPSVKAYRRRVDDYRRHMGALVNSIKHEQGRLRLFAMTGADDAIYGYFAEAPSDDGSLGPNANVHGNRDTAFSFSRDMRYHVSQLFAVSLALCDSISSLATVEIPMSGWTAQACDYMRLRDLVGLVSALPDRVFPDEETQAWPEVELPPDRGKHSRELVVAFPSVGRRPSGLRRILRVRVFLGADGTTVPLALPYTSGRWMNRVGPDS